MASRRVFIGRLGAGGAGVLASVLLAARGREALAGAAAAAAETASGGALLRLDSNENPRGPCRAAVDALLAAVPSLSRYPDQPEVDLRDRLASLHAVPPEAVLAACGSTEILSLAVQAFTGPGRPLVRAVPSFEAPAGFAAQWGAPVVEVPLDRDLRTDLAAMAERGRGAGLLYVCNPNNPTATMRDAREVSKAYGLAGLRIGYAVSSPSIVAELARRKLPSGVNGPGAAAALASLGDPGHLRAERSLNLEARRFTERALAGAGLATVPSHANFLMVDVRRDAAAFRQACRRRGVLIGRPFPPLDTFARISIGTLDEMRRAAGVIREVLNAD
ncbi:MAG TPA: aminotransferase class I/II-fold pyridoxal phosphate-dependent enzyme [Candidatus Polarisedimenticolia bacterium]|nr:aminotransferase class I/II-fold pyridoxal phosphate-dependent enzyme [Candidatus Polarisedimenticolia bacterium]